MAIDFSIFSGWLGTLIVGGAMGGVMIYLILQMIPFRAFLTAKRTHCRLVRFFTDDGRELFEPENCDATDHHFSKILKERVYGPLKKDKDTKMFGFIPCYSFASNNSAVLEPYAIVGMQRLMDITHTMTAEQALETVSADRRAHRAITQLVEIGKRVGIDNIADLEKKFNEEIRARRIGEQQRVQMDGWLIEAKRVAKEKNVNSKITFDELLEIRDSMLRLPMEKVKVQKMNNGQMIEVEEERPMEIRVGDGMIVDLKVIARSYEGTWHPRDKFSFYLAAVEEGAKTASVDQDIRRLEIWRKNFMWLILGGLGIVGLAILAFAFGPQIAENADQIIGTAVETGTSGFAP